MVPLKSGSYCDTGYRFRRNDFFRTDFWIFSKQAIDPFYDFIHYNTDCFEVPKQNDVIAEMYYRLNNIQIKHTRNVISFMDFVGTIGGVTRILMRICGVFYLNYAMFNSSFNTISSLYIFEQS